MLITRHSSPNKKGGSMNTYRVVLSWNVQKTYFVEAHNEEEAEDLAHSGEGLDESLSSYEYEDHIETVKEDE